MSTLVNWLELHGVLLSAIIVVIGWFFTDYKNRKLEIEKVRLPQRVAMLKQAIYCLNEYKLSVSQLDYERYTKEELRDIASQADTEIQIIGTKEEIALWHSFCPLTRGCDPNKIKPAYEELITLLINNVQKELNIPCKEKKN